MSRWLVLGLVLGALVAPSGSVRAQAATDLVRPELIEQPAARYPEGGRGDASVVLELELAEDGTVTRATVMKGEAPFAEAARLAALAYRFTPATRNGLPVRARVLAQVSFREPAPPAAPSENRGASGATLEPGASAAPSTAAASPGAAASAASEKPPVEVVVLDERRRELGSIHIPREEARRIPGAFSDPFRAVEVLPGVAPILSGLPYFYVRGAPPGDVGYFIDGIQVPILFHVGAGPSIVAPALVDSVELHPGAYPARFGRYAGGIMTGETLPPANRGRAEAQARIFDAGAMLEAPFAGQRGSVLVGGRYGYTQALLALVAPDFSLAYGDYQARLAYTLGTKHRLSVFAFGAFDQLRNETEARTLFDVEFHRIDLRWDRVERDRRVRLGLTLGSDRVRNSDEDAGEPPSVRSSRGTRVRFELDERTSPELRLRAGADAGVERYATELEEREGALRTFPARTDWTGGAWADAVLRPARGVELVPGARADFHRTREDDFAFVEPRLATRVRVMHGLSWVTGFGIAHQLPAASGRVPGGGTGGLESSPQEAWQASQGAEFVLPASLLGKLTLFHSRVDATDSPDVMRSFGLELFLRRDFTQRLGGFLSYTLARTERSFASVVEPSEFDRTHVLSGVLGYELGAGFRVGSRAYYASGRPYAFSCPRPDCGPGDPEVPRPYLRRGRLPGFFRLDARFEKRWSSSSGTWITVALEWFNALLAAEVTEREWNPANGGFSEEDQGVLTLPSIGIEAGY